MRAFTRPPGPSFVAPFPDGCERTFVAPVPLDLDRALEQHRAYRRALVDAGCDVVVLDALDAHPDAVFVEDVAVVLPEVTILGRPGAASRRGEVAAIEAALPTDRPRRRIESPATLEGGDVLRLGRTLLVGLSTRTNEAGVGALARVVAEHGYTVEAVPVEGALHLETVCTAVDERTVLVDPGRVDPAVVAHDRGPAKRVVEVDPSEPGAANVLRVGDAVIASASFPRTAARLRARGFDVRTVALSDFEACEGGPTCLALLAPHPPA